MSVPLRSEASRTLANARTWRGAAAIIAIVMAVYAPSLGGGFVWDDDIHLLENPVFEAGGLFSIWFSPPQIINYWPLTFTSYWLEHALWGFDPLGYRVTNALLHALASIALWRVLLRLSVPLAWLAAVVFAVHPVNVESVAWIAQRKNILSLLFFLFAVWSYLRFEAEHRWSYYAGSIASHLLAMLGKGAAAPLPAVLLLLAWWKRGAVSRRDILLALPFFLVTAIASLIEVSTQILVADDQIIRDDDFLARLAGAGWVVWFYLAKALFPASLSFVYPRWEIHPDAVLAWVPLAAGLLLLGMLWRIRNGRGRALLVALLFYIVMLSPVLGFFDIYYMRYSYVADHYQYLALVGIVAFVIGAAGKWLETRSSIGRPLRVALAAALVIALGATSAGRATHFHDAQRLWRKTLDENPDAFLAHFNLAHLLQEQKQYQDAATHYRESLRVRPMHLEALNNLAKLLADMGDVDAAITRYRDAIAHGPDYAAPRSNLGVLLHRSGELDAAREVFEDGLRLLPDSAVLHFNYARLLADAGERQRALSHHKRAIALAPNVRSLRTGSLTR